MGNPWDPELYDRKHSFVWKQAASLLELLRPEAGERILDLGCGTGHLTAQIAATGAEVIGLDSSPAMIEQARRSHPQLRFELADARSFTFDTLFDAVFSNAALHWITEPERVIASVHRALKPGGRFVAEFGGQGNVGAIVAALAAAAPRVDAPPFVNRWYFPSIAEYGGLLARSGFDVSHATLLDRPTPLEGEQGLSQWVEMFAGDFLKELSPDRRGRFLAAVEEEARPALYRDGTWFADYRRLRIVARKQET
jgi:trans-aconitate 2-methyltransferase